MSDLSAWPAPPTSVEALHTAGALSNGASATETAATELHGNSVPCLPNGAAIGRTSSQALHPEQTETPPTKTELSSQQTAGTVHGVQRGSVKMVREGRKMDGRGSRGERQGEGKDGRGVCWKMPGPRLNWESLCSGQRLFE